MADEKRIQRLHETKVALSKKYEHLANIASGKPKQTKFKHRAEAYRRQAELLAPKSST